MQSARRSFLFGRSLAPATPWSQFCQRLARTCLGRVDDTGEAQEEGRAARLALAGMDDVLRARALCAEYGVRLALAGAGRAAPGGPVLWLDPTVALTRLEPLADSPGLWRAEAGVPVADLLSAGLTQFVDAPVGMTLAGWLADRAADLCATGRTAHAGVLGLDVMLADGTRTALGPFGERDVQPLRSAAVQQLIPRLFELAGGGDAQVCMVLPRWPARVRLDALRPHDGGVNLAHLLLGHAGTLAWVEAAVLAAPRPDPATQPEAPPVPPACMQAAARLDAAAKSLFDPNDLFSSTHRDAARAG